jgi:hypothetical protein
MKKILSFTILLMSVFSFTACSSDSDDEENTNASITGKWFLRDANGEKYSSNRQYLLINPNHDYQVYPSGNPFGLPDKGTWTYEGSYLTLNKTSKFHVDKLTSTTLVLSSENLKFTFEREKTEETAQADGQAGVINKLVGKWILKQKKYWGETSWTDYTDRVRYMILKQDKTFEINPRNTLEAEKTSGSWYLESNGTIIVIGEDKYRILSLSSTRLQLGWLEDGDVVEWSIFDKSE